MVQNGSCAVWSGEQRCKIPKLPVMWMHYSGQSLLFAEMTLFHQKNSSN
jgi:hypothetical protein